MTLLDKPFIIIDNFLSKNDFKIVEKQIELDFDKLAEEFRTDGSYYKTVDLDHVYKDRREQQPIFKVFQENMWSKKTINMVSKFDGLAFKLFNFKNTYYSALRIYPQENNYVWHTDINMKTNVEVGEWNKQFLSCIWYYKPKNTFSGGQLEAKGFPLIEVKNNRLVIIDASVLHRIHGIKMKDGLSSESINGRICVNLYLRMT